MNYYIANCAVRSYEEGVILTVRDVAGRMLGDICVTPRRKVDKIDLVHTIKNMLRSEETFSILVKRAMDELKPFVETMDVKIVF